MEQDATLSHFMSRCVLCVLALLHSRANLAVGRPPTGVLLCPSVNVDPPSRPRFWFAPQQLLFFQSIFTRTALQAVVAEASRRAKETPGKAGLRRIDILTREGVI